MRTPQRTKKPKSKLEALFPIRASRIPRQIQSAGELWLEFFQQFCDLVVDEHALDYGNKDQAAITRARILADMALSAFQERFPGVHPQ